MTFFLRPDAPCRRTVEIAGPQRMTLAQIVASYRRWLGLPAAKLIRLPLFAASLGSRLGDAVSFLGWRPPLRTTALRQLSRALARDPAEWTRITGIAPTRLETALALGPASVQDRWPDPPKPKPVVTVTKPPVAKPVAKVETKPPVTKPPATKPVTKPATKPVTKKGDNDLFDSRH